MYILFLVNFKYVHTNYISIPLENKIRLVAITVDLVCLKGIKMD